MPWYLARHYWWAYLWRVGVWFFDHSPVINAILFGQYRKLMEATLSMLDGRKDARVLQLSCVYGAFTPRAAGRLGRPMVLVDVAGIQLRLARRKVPEGRLLLAQMDAERLGLAESCVDQVVIFFLFHEMPPEARARTMAEAVRVLRPGGSLVITEYAPAPRRHPLFRFPPARALLTRLEPFLGGFWDEDLDARAIEAAAGCGKTAVREREAYFFRGFYRVVRFRLQF